MHQTTASRTDILNVNQISNFRIEALAGFDAWIPAHTCTCRTRTPQVRCRWAHPSNSPSPHARQY